MKIFAESAHSYIASTSNARERERAWDHFQATGLPTTSDEVWRYAPLGELELDHFEVTKTPTPRDVTDFARRLSATGGHVIRVVDGFLYEQSPSVQGVRVFTREATTTLGGEDAAQRYASDAFALLSSALSPSCTVVEIDARVNVDEPIIILHETSGSASFSHTHVKLGDASSATVVEYFEGGANALVVPLSEYEVGNDASLHLISYQRLDDTAWHIARSTGYVRRDARLRQAVLGMGAHYNRSRNDAQLLGTGAENELRTTFLGAGRQVHDFRTHQFHQAARSRSTLLSKGAVADVARSVYTGLIEIEKGAKRTDARQTNHNLLLSTHAHADSVPNLDIRENDVMCAHASSVGPLDELQRWYLESRGVTRPDAERLIVQGFFYEMLVDLPSELASLVEGDVTHALSMLQGVSP